VEQVFQLQAIHTQTAVAVAAVAEESWVVQEDSYIRQVEMNPQASVAVQALTLLLVMK
jgi:hypothetical protein